MNWELNKDNLDTVRGIAKEWPQGIFILKPFNGDFVFLAISRVDFYNPSDNIHHTTVEGKDVTLAVIQKLSGAELQGRSSISTYIDNIKFEESWEIPQGEKYLWIRVNQRQ